MKTIFILFAMCLMTTVVDAQKKSTVKSKEAMPRLAANVSYFNDTVKIKYQTNIVDVSLMDMGSIKYKRLEVKDSTGVELLSLTKNDTLIVGTGVKNIKVGNTIVPVSVMTQPGIYVTLQDFQKLQGYILDFPARWANPILDLIEKYFGLSRLPQQ